LIVAPGHIDRPSPPGKCCHIAATLGCTSPGLNLAQPKITSLKFGPNPDQICAAINASNGFAAAKIIGTHPMNNAPPKRPMGVAAVRHKIKGVP